MGFFDTLKKSLVKKPKTGNTVLGYLTLDGKSFKIVHLGFCAISVTNLVLVNDGVQDKWKFLEATLESGDVYAIPFDHIEDFIVLSKCKIFYDKGVKEGQDLLTKVENLGYSEKSEEKPMKVYAAGESLASLDKSVIPPIGGGLPPLGGAFGEPLGGSDDGVSTTTIVLKDDDSTPTVKSDKASKDKDKAVADTFRKLYQQTTNATDRLKISRRVKNLTFVSMIDPWSLNPSTVDMVNFSQSDMQLKLAEQVKRYMAGMKVNFMDLATKNLTQLERDILSSDPAISTIVSKITLKGNVELRNLQAVVIEEIENIIS